MAQNMFLGNPITRLGVITDRAAMQKRATELLAQLDPGIDVKAKIKTLRVAQRQIVEIAKALLGEARVIAMDEPTSSLTPVEFEKLVTVIERLKASGVAVIYVSHKLDEVFRVASHATILRDGKMVADVDLATTNEDAVVSMMVGRALEIPPHQSHVQNETILAVEGLSRGSHVRDVSFTLRKGEVLGIAGLVGSGRTELVKLLAGVDRPTAGKITLKGQAAQFCQSARCHCRWHCAAAGGPQEGRHHSLALRGGQCGHPELSPLDAGWRDQEWPVETRGR